MFLSSHLKRCGICGELIDLHCGRMAHSSRTIVDTADMQSRPQPFALSSRSEPHQPAEFATSRPAEAINGAAYTIVQKQLRFNEREHALCVELAIPRSEANPN